MPLLWKEIGYERDGGRTRIFAFVVSVTPYAEYATMKVRVIFLNNA